jgi:hypothetical protein
MSAPVPPRSDDIRLAALLGAATDVDAWRAIEDLLAGTATLVRETVSRRLSRSRQAASEIDDVVAEVGLKLTQKLQSLRAGAGEPIENLHAYCVTTSEHVCYGFLRRQFPERTRLRNRMRYALTHHPAMTLEEDSQGVWRCRASRMRAAAPAGSARALLDDPREFAARASIDLSLPLAHVMAALLARCEAPVEFDRFVEVLATLLGVRDVPAAVAATDGTGSDGTDAIPDMTPGIQTVLEQRRAAPFCNCCRARVLSRWPPLPGRWTCPRRNCSPCGTRCRSTTCRSQPDWASPGSR